MPIISYGATRTVNGFEITTTGYPSKEEAVAACYEGPVRYGWRPRPLRVRWWQLWRPREYEPGLALALQEAGRAVLDEQKTPHG